MNIRSLTLKNFQKHSNLTLELKDGINIIHGRSDVGKSAIRRSIEWALFCENISGIQKEGTDCTSVTILFDNGIELERIRTKTINRYILREGEKELTFDKFGRDLPDEIKEKLNIKTIEIDGVNINLNISRQLDAPFLIGKDFSGSFRQKLFNKLTGADLIDTVLKKLGKKIRGFDTDSKYAKEQLEKDTENLVKVEAEHKDKFKLLAILKSKYNKINKLQEKNEILQEGLMRLNTNTENVTSVTEKLQDIQVVETKGLRENIEKLEQISDLSTSLICNNSHYIKAESELEKIMATTIDFGDLKSKINRLDTLNSILESNNSIDSNYTKLAMDLGTVGSEIVTLEKSKKELLKEMPICPLCGKDNK